MLEYVIYYVFNLEIKKRFSDSSDTTTVSILLYKSILEDKYISRTES